jgi:hypothetical protein
MVRRHHHRRLFDRAPCAVYSVMTEQPASGIPHPQRRSKPPKTQAHWDATANAYRRWRASGPSSKGQLRSFIQAEFKQRHLSGHRPFWDKALLWPTLRLAAEQLARDSKDARFNDLADWLDSADSHSLTVTRYLKRLSTAQPIPQNPTCVLHALDFLLLRNGKLNDNLADAALETLRAQDARTATCTTLSWDAAISRQLLKIRSHANKIVLARYREGHWTGIFFDLAAGEVFINNPLPSFPADTLKVVTDFLQALG